jgi:iron complex outermembrane recepter protein
MQQGHMASMNLRVTQFNLLSYLNLPQDIQVDTMLNFAGGLRTFSVPAYTRFDSRIAWHSVERLELSVIGQNLSQPRHLELTPVNRGIFMAQVKRRFYCKLTWGANNHGRQI